MIWRWLKPRWLGSLIFVGVILLTTLLHDEYVEYVDITQQARFLVLSYAIKWGINLSALAGFIVYSLPKASAPAPRRKDSTRSQATAITESNQGAEQASRESPGEHIGTKGDGFDFLRHKKTLKGKGDQLIQHKSPRQS
jgi:hypothetical protein